MTAAQPRATSSHARTRARTTPAAHPLRFQRQSEVPMFMFDRRQLFVGAALIVLIEIVTAAMRATGH